MKRILGVLPLIAMLFFTSAPAKADFSIVYPDGSVGLVWALGGGAQAFVFADFTAIGDDDIFTSHTTQFSSPLFANLGVGASSYIGYWLDFLYVDVFGGFVYDVWATQGGSFFFVGTYLL